MAAFTIREAETQLSRLIEQAQRGEEVVICQDNKPLVRIVPVEDSPKKRKLGILRGAFEVGPEFFEPLPEDELRYWEGEDDPPPEEKTLA